MTSSTPGSTYTNRSDNRQQRYYRYSIHDNHHICASIYYERLIIQNASQSWWSCGSQPKQQQSFSGFERFAAAAATTAATMGERHVDAPHGFVPNIARLFDHPFGTSRLVG